MLMLCKRKVRAQIMILLNFNCLKNCRDIKTFFRKKKLNDYYYIKIVIILSTRQRNYYSIYYIICLTLS